MIKKQVFKVATLSGKIDKRMCLLNNIYLIFNKLQIDVKVKIYVTLFQFRVVSVYL